MGIAILSILDLEESPEDSAVSKLIQCMNQGPTEDIIQGGFAATRAFHLS